MQDLLQTIAKAGLIAEELDHRMTVVEEMPLSQMMQRLDYQSSLDYNIAQCAYDALLHGLYGEPFNAVLHAMLAHNHAIMICRAFLTRAQWRLAAITELEITFCDEQGRLSIDLFTATAQGYQLKQILERGVLCEFLTWKMDVEEPEAAATISLAENEVNQVGMRTTEIEAIKHLKGQVIIAMSKDVSE